MSDSIVRRTSGLLEARLEGELVGLNVEQGACYGFNATATRVWELIEQPTPRSALRETLLREYEVDAETCDRELDVLLGELQRHGLVAVEPAPR